MDLNVIRSLTRDDVDTKVLLLVMDGLGGLPRTPGGPTELETAATPNLDRLAAEGICGLHVAVGPGVTPGSGPAHLGLFGYDPLIHDVGRGVLSALGIGFDLDPADVAARGNFCTVDADGIVTDRRAGRIDTATGRRLCEKLRAIELDGVELHVEAEKEYRFVLVLRGTGLSGEVAETDPQHVGHAPHRPTALADAAARTAAALQQFVARAGEILADEHPANMVLLRGFSMLPDWPRFPAVFGVRAAAVAAYPMYRGAARLVGMDVIDAGETWDTELDALERCWHQHDFFFLHFKKTDSAGEDGDFDRKVALIEEVDAAIPRIMDLKPDVVVVTGDHSTPATMKTHSWHPVPALLWAPATGRPDGVARFGERPCLAGALGPRIPATQLLPLAFAHAGRFDKFGA